MQIYGNCSWTGDSVTAVICRCKNDEVATALASLPVEVKNLTFYLNSDLAGHFIIPPIELYNISHLFNLEYLALKHGYKQMISSLMFTPHTFENLTKLKELHINIITNNYDIGNITRWTSELKVLDLTYTKYLNKFIVQNIFRSGNFPTLNTLALKSFQMPGVSGFSDILNISESFGKSNSLQHLDLSTNMLGVIKPSIVIMFPNLIFLDVSQNTLVSQYNNPFLLETVMHPSLEILNLGHQGEGYVTHNSEMTNSDNIKGDEKSFHDQQTKFQFAFQCINSNANGNVSSLFIYSPVFCAVVTCFMGEHSLYWHEIPCQVYGKIEEYIDFSCPYFIRLPVIKRLKTLTANFLNWINAPSPVMHYEFCFDKSILQYIDVSNNKKWIHSSLYYGFLQQLSLTSVFRETKTLDLSYNNFISVPNGTLLNLEILNAASNDIHFSNESLCHMYPNLKNVSIAQNKLSYLFPDILGIVNIWNT